MGGYNSQDPLFSKEAVDKIYSYTQGVPRLINSICDSALLYGYGASQKIIDLNIVEEVIQDRGIDPGIQYEEKEISRDDKGYLGKGAISDSAESISKHLYLQISNLNERLTRIEQRISQLEDIDNHHTVSELIAWLKSSQKENQELEKKYSALLAKYKTMNDLKPKR